jgi:2-methylcitrate synthase
MEFADSAQFEEVAYLLVHERLPDRAELAGYKRRLRALRGLRQAARLPLGLQRPLPRPRPRPSAPRTPG